MSIELNSKPIDVDDIEVLTLSDVMGAEIWGVDLSEDLDSATLDAIQRAWLENCLIVVRNQQLDDGDLVRFSRYFGELTMGPNMAWQPKEGREHPEIFVISNVVQNGHPIGFLGDTELSWHTDQCHTELPPKATTLHAREIPEDGSGDTGYMNMYAMLEALPSELRRRIDGLQLKHEAGHTLQGEVRFGLDEGKVINIENAPGPVHPLVRTHPETGRKAIYVGSHTREIEGWDFHESRTLIDSLIEHSTQPEFIYQHKWNAGDMVLWDNRSAMHRGLAFEDQKVKRRLHRTTIAGTGPTL